MRLFAREIFHFMGAASAIALPLHFGWATRGWAVAIVWPVLVLWELGNVKWGTQDALKTWADCTSWNLGILVGSLVFPIVQ